MCLVARLVVMISSMQQWQISLKLECVEHTNNKTCITRQADTGKMRDALANLLRSARRCILYSSIVHTFTRQPGSLQPIITEKKAARMDQHGRSYQQDSMLFVPDIADACRGLKGNFLMLCSTWRIVRPKVSLLIIAWVRIPINNRICAVWLKGQDKGKQWPFASESSSC